ncbi:hypothetical protein V1511DRAFT_506608 [Dipodascopsis uninucleata]
MSIFSALSTTAPYHLFAYSTVLGSTIYQSFFIGITAFRALPRQHFSALQRKVFPPYFAMQAAVPVFLGVTAPFPILQDYLSLGSLAVAALTGLINAVIIGPMTVKLMTQRKAQEDKESKKYYEADVSEEMKTLNKQFGAIHGISTIFNLATLFALCLYGVVLSNATVKGFAK